MKKERKTDSRASARACVLWTGALTLQKGAVRARCAKRKTEKKTLRERERAGRARACSCAMDGLLGSCPPLVLNADKNSLRVKVGRTKKSIFD